VTSWRQSRLDKQWIHQDVVYNFNYELEAEVHQFICDVVQDTDKEEYLRLFLHIGLIYTAEVVGCQSVARGC